MLTRRRAASVLVVLLGVTAIVWLVVCAKSVQNARIAPAADATDAERPIEVELSGCAAMRMEGDGKRSVCELGEPRTLRLFTRGGAVTIAGASEPPAPVEGGTLHRLTMAADAKEVKVTSASGRVVFAMPLGAKSAPAWLDRARALRGKGDVDGARALARAAETSADMVERAFALGFLARLELAAGRQDASFALFREAIGLHRRAGRVSDAADDSFALVFALNQRSFRYAEARATLDETRETAPGLGAYADGRAREAYYRGTLSTETGDARAALRWLDEAERRATRLGLDLLARNARSARAMQLAQLGRTTEALEVLVALDAKVREAGTPCEAMEVAINRGFVALVAKREAEALPPLERALGLSQSASCDRYLRIAALGNLSLASLAAGDVTTAKRRLDEARGGDAEVVRGVRGVERAFWSELEGRIALARDDATAALAAFDEELSLARSIGSVEGQWRASSSRGAALEKLGRNEDALAAYRAAETLLTDASVLVPLGEGRATFVGDHEESARSAITLALAMRHDEDALAIARASRARILASLASRAKVESFDATSRARWDTALGAYQTGRAALDTEARDDWKLARTELAKARATRAAAEAKLRAALDEVIARPDTAAPPRLPADAVTLVFHPARRGWVGFVAGAGESVAPFTIETLPHLDDAARLADVLVGPARARLVRVPRLRVLGYGPLRAVDVHALPWNGAPLVAAVTVTYPLDLPEAKASARPAHALVVADPTLDLAGAHAEHAFVARALRDAGVSLDAFDGPRATSRAVLPMLARATLFHYAGHGRFEGREGWESTLPLAEGGHLGVGDVLAAPSLPSRVVLSGCDAARGEATHAETLGLAQAFVVGGSEVVVAPSRPVADAAALAMTRALYMNGGVASSRPAADVLREAQTRLAGGDGGSTDWAAFRAVTR